MVIMLLIRLAFLALFILLVWQVIIPMYRGTEMFSLFKKKKQEKKELITKEEYLKFLQDTVLEWQQKAKENIMNAEKEYNKAEETLRLATKYKDDAESTLELIDLIEKNK